MQIFKTIGVFAIVTAVALVTTMTAPPAARSQSPQVTPPQDKDTLLPQFDFYDDLCDQCRAKLKKRMKDPNARPMFGARQQRHMQWSDRTTGRHLKRRTHHNKIHRRAEMRRSARREASREMNDLGLSDAQREQLRDMRHAQQKVMIDLQAALKKEKLELRHKLESGDVSDAELREHIDRVSKKRADVEFEKLKSRLDRKKVLTDEQRAKTRHGRR